MGGRRVRDPLQGGYARVVKCVDVRLPVIVWCAQFGFKEFKVRLRSPINYFGGKGSLSPKLIELFPAHHIYVEPFFGGGSVLFAKPASPVEIANDLWKGAVEFYAVLRDAGKFARFQQLAESTPFSRDLYREFVSTWADTSDEVERAWKWFCIARWSFSGNFGKSWGYTVQSSNRGMAASVSRWISTVERLPEVSARLKRVQLECDDAARVIERYDTERTLFYCDPPYVHSTRKSSKDYKFEMSDDQHRALVRLLLRCKGKVLLSGYQNEIYALLEAEGWERRDFEVSCMAAGRTRYTGLQGVGAAAKQRRVESVWANYKLPG